jgi:hypothetical protein
MAPRDKRLEQQQPAGDSPAKAWQRKHGKGKSYAGKFKPERDTPKGTVKQHRAKPGMTSPQ